MTTVSVGLLGADDREALHGLFAETESYYGLPAPDRAVADKAIDRLVGPGDPRCFLAKRDGVAVGYLVFAVLVPPLKGALFVKELFIAEAARGQGVGPVLLRAVAEFGLREGCVRLDLTTDRDNDGALRFYQRIGGAIQDGKAFFRFDRTGMGRLAEQP